MSSTTTRFFDGPSPEFNSIFAHNKVTFKVKPEKSHEIADGVLPERTAMFATNGSLIEQSELCGLTRKQMYKVKSNYQSLCLMSSQAPREPLKDEGILCSDFI
jgi:hypothetical protein